VLADGQPTDSCPLPADNPAGTRITTIEAIGEDLVGRRLVAARVAPLRRTRLGQAWRAG